jgi:Uncharacterized protein containing LysM domain
VTKKLLLPFLALLLCGTVSAKEITLNPTHPERYVVVQGDTLWDIAARFLRNPWLWPEVWYVNSQIKNPHLIYPGDLIILAYADGKPQLQLERGGARAERLAPQVRVLPLEQAIPTIPIDALKPFLTRPRVMTPNELTNSGYVVANAEERLISGAGDHVYVRNLTSTDKSSFTVFRAGSAYVDPETDEILGYEALYLGDASVKHNGDPATFLLTLTDREVLVGDRLMAALDAEIQQNFIPKAPATEVEGRIITGLDAVSQIGQFQVVVLNLGGRDGVAVGDVLAVYQAGPTIRDVVSQKQGATVKLPDERAGELMIFRIFEKVSYALIMKATQAIHVFDKVRNP